MKLLKSHMLEFEQNQDNEVSDLNNILKLIAQLKYMNEQLRPL